MKNDIHAEKTLNVIANTILIVGSITALIVFFYLTAEYENILGLIYAILILLSSITLGVTYKVFINISLTLREINNSKKEKSETNKELTNSENN